MCTVRRRLFSQDRSTHVAKLHTFSAPFSLYKILDAKKDLLWKGVITIIDKKTMYTTERTIAVTAIASGLDALDRVHISRSLLNPAPTIIMIVCIQMVPGAHSSLRVSGSPCARTNEYAAKSHETVKKREKHR